MNWNGKRNSGGVAIRRAHTTARVQIVQRSPVEVCVVADSRLAAEAVVWSLGQTRDIHAVAVPAASLAATADTRANVVLLDAGIPDSVGVVEALQRAHPEAKLIITNVRPTDERVGEFVTRGVAGFVLTDGSLEELGRTIRAVADGMAVLPTGLTESLLSGVRAGAGQWSGTARAEELPPRFTRRETEVIDLVCAGLSTRVIGKRLNISCHTVKSHVRTVLAKLALHSRLELAAWAYRDHAADDS